MESSEFNEFIYLHIHEDVRRAVQNGGFSTGYDHYIKYGQQEGRQTSRFINKDRLHFLKDYTILVNKLLQEHPDNHHLAMAKAIGSSTIETFKVWGDKQVEILKKFGLNDGMSIYDLACGSGRTAQALSRIGWHGSYRGADIINELIEYAKSTLPGYEFVVHQDFSIYSDDQKLDIIYAWSLFTHLQPEETYLYIRDIHRALKKGGCLIFSFLEIDMPVHWDMFVSRVNQISKGWIPVHLDYIFDRKMISRFASEIGFRVACFIDGNDDTATPLGRFGQSIVVLIKE
jgi:SAM-dependent methyltransferase